MLEVDYADPEMTPDSDRKTQIPRVPENVQPMAVNAREAASKQHESLERNNSSPESGIPVRSQVEARPALHNGAPSPSQEPRRERAKEHLSKSSTAHSFRPNTPHERGGRRPSATRFPSSAARPPGNGIFRQPTTNGTGNKQHYSSTPTPTENVVEMTVKDFRTTERLSVLESSVLPNKITPFNHSSSFSTTSSNALVGAQSKDGVPSQASKLGAAGDSLSLRENHRSFSTKDALSATPPSAPYSFHQITQRTSDESSFPRLAQTQDSTEGIPSHSNVLQAPDQAVRPSNFDLHTGLVSNVKQLNLSSKKTSTETNQCENPPNSNAVVRPAVVEPTEKVVIQGPESVSLPLTFLSVESALKKQILHCQLGHARITKVTLRKARTCISQFDHATSVPTSDAAPKFCQNFSSDESPFRDMKRKDVSPNTAAPATQTMLQSAYVGRTHNKEAGYYAKVSPTLYRSDALTVPAYTHHVGLRSNVLTANDKTLVAFPYFNDASIDPTQGELFDELKHRYRICVTARPSILLRREKCKMLKPVISRLLKEIGSSVDDVLHYLLDSSLPLDPGTFEQWQDVSKAWMKRSRNREDLRLSKKDFSELLSNMQNPTNRGIAMASLTCYVFERVFGFSIWHVVKRTIKTNSNEFDDTFSAKQAPAGLSRTCRVCLSHNCPYHGEMRDLDCSESGDSEPDMDDQPQVNQRIRVNTYVKESGYEPAQPGQNDIKDEINSVGMQRDFSVNATAPCRSLNCFMKERASKNQSLDTETLAFEWNHTDKVLFDSLLPYSVLYPNAPCVMAQIFSQTYPQGMGPKDSRSSPLSCSQAHHKILEHFSEWGQSSTIPTPVKVPTIKKSAAYWMANSKTHLVPSRPPFYPCDHEGTCEQAKCRCFRDSVACEKTCSCPESCGRRFRGCSCARIGRICWTSRKCECWLLNRECDVDLCKTCGASEVMDPCNRRDKSITLRRCNNMEIQRGIPKKLLLGVSQVAGYGLSAGEPIKKNSFIGEYKGEIVSQQEADRRGTIYHHRATNYLFQLNEEQELDSTHAGNKTRFINHAGNEENINCYAKNLLCNTVTRIGMWARRDIAVGEELFFNYNYPPSATAHFLEKTPTQPQLVGVKSRKAKRGNRKKATVTRKVRAAVLAERREKAANQVSLAALTSDQGDVNEEGKDNFLHADETEDESESSEGYDDSESPPLEDEDDEEDDTFQDDSPSPTRLPPGVSPFGPRTRGQILRKRKRRSSPA